MELHLEHDFTFNPDGSGRVTVRWTGPAGPGAAAPDEFVRSELQRAQGVEAWADVHCSVEDEHLVFTGTAWFPDITTLRFHCQGLHCNLLDFAISQDGDGEVTVTSRLDQQPMTATLPAGANRAAIAEAMAGEREKLQQAREFLDGMFGGLHCTAVLRLPGRLREPVRGQQLDERTTTIDFHGRDLLLVIDRLLSDDRALQTLMEQGDTSPAAALALLGDAGPVTLRTHGGAAMQFDYGSEVAAANAAWADLMQSDSPPPRLKEQGPPLQNVRVVAAKTVFEADGDRDLQPMGQNSPGVSLTIAGNLDRVALRVDEVTWDSARTDDDVELAPADEWHRRISFPKLTKDGITVFFDVDLPLPPPGSRGLRSLQGRAQCLVGLGEDRVDLGFDRLEAGATGTVAGAQLTRADGEDGRWTFEVQLRLARDRILAMYLEADGNTLELRQCGYSSCNDECSLTYDFEGELPIGARLVARLVTEVQPVEVPFALPAIDWLGQPR
ncbi:MAG: hypothetical protein IPK26_28355 [Planctomycetes bacterium]|nr:hypothetical protein [Planctomycetota bacterium]